MFDVLLDRRGEVVSLEALQQRALLLTALTHNHPQTATAALAIAGGGELLTWLWQPQSWPPSMAILRQGTSYEVVISGTQNAKQILAHLGGAIGTQVFGSPGEVHSAHLTAWEKLFPTIAATVDQGADEITVSGHSYGGSIAAIALLDPSLQSHAPAAVIRAATFGAPRSLIATQFPPPWRQLCRVNSTLDPVPKLPARVAIIASIRYVLSGSPLQSLRIRWTHFGHSVHLDAAGNLAAIVDEDDSGNIAFLTGDKWDPDTHVMAEYLRRLNAYLRRVYGR